MLLQLLTISGAFTCIALLVALEAALAESRRTFLPRDTRADEGGDSASAPQVTVSDFIFSARIATAVLLIVSGFLLGRCWASTLSLLSHLEGSATVGTGGVVYYTAAALLGMCALSFAVVFCIVVPFQLGSIFHVRVVSSLSWLGRATVSLLWPLVLCSRALNRLAPGQEGEQSEAEEEAIEEDIRSLVEEGERAGVIEEQEREIITRVFKLGDKPLASLMTPRSDVVFLRASMSVEEALAVVLDARYTWYPVLNGEREEVVGLVSSHDVYNLSKNPDDGKFGLKGIVTSAMDVPESMTALELLERFREQSARLAIVRDEYGSVAGIATVGDVLKVIVGELGDTQEEEKSVVARDDGSLLVDASSDVENLFELLSINDGAHTDQAPFHSVGGFVMTCLGRIPKVGDYFQYDGHRFEVVDMDGKRIDKVLVARVVSKTAVGG